MKRTKLFLLAFLSISFWACQPPAQLQETVQLIPVEEEVDANGRRSPRERVVIANRTSRDLTIINAKNDKVLGTIPMPDNGEPMYAVHVAGANAVFVGDRANNRVVAFDESTFAVLGTVAAGAGVFHMWASADGSQLWVNNDIDNTTTIIDPINMSVLGTAQTPADLVALGGKPHDVFVSPDGLSAYVSVLGIAGANDYVISYSTSSFAEQARAAVGQDPHLFADDINNNLYVACQNTNEVIVLDRNTLASQTSIPFAGAHGIFMPQSGDKIYVADIGGARLGVIGTATNTVLGQATNTSVATPHNLAVNAKGSKLYVTHSGGTANQVTIYRLNKTNPIQKSSLTAGTNPFGLTFYGF